MINSIKGKLTLGLTFAITVFIILIVFTSTSHRSIIKKYETLTDNISYAENMAYLSEEVNQGIIQLYVTYDQAVQNKLADDLAHLDMTMAVMTTNMTTESSWVHLRRLEKVYLTLSESAEYFMARDATSSVVTLASNRDIATRSNAALQAVIQDLTKSELQHLQSMRVDLKARETTMRMQLVIFVLMAISVLIFTLWHLNSSIYKNAEKLRNLFKAIGAGDLDCPMPEINSNDEFKDLLIDIVAMKESLQTLNHEKEMSKNAIITAVGRLAEMRDNDTGEHINNIQDYLSLMCDHMMVKSRYKNILSQNFIQTLIQVSPLHDIGKVGIPDAILLKPGKLTGEEFRVMKGHVHLGQMVIHQAYEIYNNGDNAYLKIAEEVIRDHHERWDGSGYPRGIRGEDISFAGRLVAIVDVYDALTTHRVYKEAYDHERAVDIIRSERGKHFDPELVDIFLAVESSFEKCLCVNRNQRIG